MSALSHLQKILPLKVDDEGNEVSLDGTDNPIDIEVPLDKLPDLINEYTSFERHIEDYRAKLAPVEKFLSEFNAELTQLSDSLLALQRQSEQLSSTADFDKTITDKLNPVILDLIVPPDVVASISTGDINEEWTENLKFINEKIQLINNIENGIHPNPAYKESRAFEHLKKNIELLRLKSIERIRDFLITQIKLLRSNSKVSSQTVQQRLLLVKDAYVFLKTNHKDLANQLQLAYIYTMRWYYHTKFAKYLYSLQSLNVRHVDSTVVLGQNPGDDRLSIFGSGFKSWISSSGAQTPTNSSNIPGLNTTMTLNEYLLSVDKRKEILETNVLEPATAIPSQIAETTPFAYWLEFIYNQWSISLVDNIVVEYLFMVEFFYQGSEKFDDVASLKLANDATGKHGKGKHDWSHMMFEGVFRIGHEFVTWLITHHPIAHTKGASSNLPRAAVTASSSGSCDAFAVLLIIRLIQQQQSRLHNEFHIPTLDDYLNSLLMILWPHFTKIVDLNCESLRRVLMRAGRETNLAPVSTTQQFAQFLLGLLKLTLSENSEYKGEPLYFSISRLRNVFETLLTKLSNHFFGTGSAKTTEKEIFLFNNYFLVVSILKNENEDLAVHGLIEDQVKHFEALCEAYKKH